jgi:hypothetical protein
MERFTKAAVAPRAQAVRVRMQALCMRCGREGHSSDECKAKLPAWPAEVRS